MKQLFVLLTLIITIVTTPVVAFAQPMMGTQSAVSSDGHTAREEAEGKEIWEKLQAKQLECKNLTDDNYSSLGEYFMGQSIGNTQRHAAMNQMMISMMGEEGEKQMHIVMGKRLSGCDTSAQIPSSGVGFMPMMWLMGSAFAPWSFGGTKGGGNSMMGYGGWSIFGLGWIFMIVFWILIILGAVALVCYLGGTKQNGVDKTSMNILKERYAKGEINKKEFEEKKKDLR